MKESIKSYKLESSILKKKTLLEVTFQKIVEVTKKKLLKKLQAN